KKKIRSIIGEFKDCRRSMNGPLGLLKHKISDDLTMLEDQILIDDNLGELIKSDVYIFGETKGWPYPTIRLNPKNGINCRTLMHEYVHWRFRYESFLGAASASLNALHGKFRGTGNGYEDDLAEGLAEKLCTECNTN